MCPGLYSSAGPRIDGAHALDGLFFATRRDVVERIGFDADTFDGFDFYDVDFSYRVHRAGFRVRIQTDLHLLHASRGNFGPRYAFYSERFRSKFPEFADPPPFQRAYIHEARVSSRDDTRRFHAWIGHWLRGAANQADRRIRRSRFACAGGRCRRRARTRTARDVDSNR